MKVKFKKLSDKGVIPKYAKAGDAGLDLTCTGITTKSEKDFAYIQYHTDLAVEIPVGYVGLIFPRSSISNTGMILANSVGVVDSGYRGELIARFKYIKDSKKYEVGDRVVQLMILPYPEIEIEEVDELEESERGETGFGSSN